MKSTQVTQVTVPVQYEPVIKLLLGLPSQWLMVVEQFVRFLTYQAQNEPTDLIWPMSADSHDSTLVDTDSVAHQNKDIEIINQRADYLDEETSDALTYQVRQTINDPLDYVLSQAGLLTKLGPELQKRALSATMSLDEVVQIMTEADGLSLNEILMEQRTAKEW